MCEPISLAMFALSAASAVTGFIGQQSQAEAQDAMYRQNQENARVSFEDKQKALSNRQSQEMEAAGAEKFDNALEARAARATNRVAAGESGVAGLTIEGLMGDMYSKESRYNDRIDQNLDWTMSQIQDEKKAAGSQYVDRVNSVSKGQKPSFINLGLKLGAAGLDSYSNYKKTTKP